MLPKSPPDHHRTTVTHPPPPPGAGEKASIPLGDLETTVAKIPAMASEMLFPEAVATALIFSASASSPMIKHAKEATSSSFCPSVSPSSDEMGIVN